MKQIILEDLSPEERRKYTEEKKRKKEEQDNSVDQLSQQKSIRYRSEQISITRLNGVSLGNSETKREFTVTKRESADSLLFDIQMTNNIINISPKYLLEAVTLMKGIDEVKCNKVTVSVNSKSGKIDNIINHQEIIDRWKSHKIELMKQYSFVRSDEAKKMLEDVINVAEKSIVNEELLKQDLGAKMFYDLFFDKYLVTTENLLSPFSRTFYSQLFEGVPVQMDYKQKILKEDPEMFLLEKNGNANKEKLNIEKIKKMYESKYQPQIQYKFSDYIYDVNELTAFSTYNNDYMIEKSNVTMTEQIKNNIQIITSYKLLKIIL